MTLPCSLHHRERGATHRLRYDCRAVGRQALQPNGSLLMLRSRRALGAGRGPAAGLGSGLTALWILPTASSSASLQLGLAGEQIAERKLQLAGVERISVPVASLEVVPTRSRRPLPVATHSAIPLGGAVPFSLRWLLRLDSRRCQASEGSDEGAKGTRAT